MGESVGECDADEATDPDDGIDGIGEDRLAARKPRPLPLPLFAAAAGEVRAGGDVVRVGTKPLPRDVEVSCGLLFGWGAVLCDEDSGAPAAAVTVIDSLTNPELPSPSSPPPLRKNAAAGASEAGDCGTDDASWGSILPMGAADGKSNEALWKMPELCCDVAKLAASAIG